MRFEHEMVGGGRYNQNPSTPGASTSPMIGTPSNPETPGIAEHDPTTPVGADEQSSAEGDAAWYVPEIEVKMTSRQHSGSRL